MTLSSVERFQKCLALTSRSLHSPTAKLGSRHGATGTLTRWPLDLRQPREANVLAMSNFKRFGDASFLSQTFPSQHVSHGATEQISHVLLAILIVLSFSLFSCDA